MRIISMHYKIEYQEGVGVEYPPVLVDTVDMSESESRRIIEPIIQKFTRLLPSDLMLKIVLNERDEAAKTSQPNRHIAEFWQEADARYLKKKCINDTPDISIEDMLAMCMTQRPDLIPLCAMKIRVMSRHRGMDKDVLAETLSKIMFHLDDDVEKASAVDKLYLEFQERTR